MASDFKQALPAGTILRGGTYSYRIRSVLGQGSFGITYLASTSMRGPLGEVAVPVAVKEFFASELDSRRPDGSVLSRTEGGVAHKYAKAFQRESLNLSGLKHPGIVNVLEAFEANGTYYYSMEYLPGGTLDAKVKGVGMPEKEALMMVSRIGEALSYLHDHKIMHLDLKPKNIMLKDDGSPVIIDFGLSKQYDSEGEPESSSTIGLGTPGYAPLEQANRTSGNLFQPTLDIYALGATLFKMLTGKTPPAATLILNKKALLTPDLQAKAVSPETADAIRKAMAPLMDDRPQRVEDFLSMLEGESEETEKEPGEETGKETGLRSERKTGRKPGTWIWALLGGLVALAVILALVFGGKNRDSDYGGTMNGHEWVDLGLSVKWATCNVGASSPEECGDYFAWGETSPKSVYDWDNYKFYVSGASSDHVSFNKYGSKSGRDTVDRKANLDLSDDAARTNWGGSWRMPTVAEQHELLSACMWTRATLEGKNGYKVTSKKNGNSIFLPTAGRRDGSYPLLDADAFGDYWSSSLEIELEDSDCAYTIGFATFGSVIMVNEELKLRCIGLPVRPVTE